MNNESEQHNVENEISHIINDVETDAVYGYSKQKSNLCTRRQIDEYLAERALKKQLDDWDI